ncbi:MAG: alanine dehydrogenase [Firmicutes bacterium]|nr:alanine dehydrogenase [Bacillota bacterium]
MIIGTPKEIKDNEYRVALVPAGVEQLVEMGHTVLVEHDAGQGTGITDDEYRKAGAEVVDSAVEVWSRADFIVKVKEPLPQEFAMIKQGQIIFTYFHFAADKNLTFAMVKSGAICMAYETIQLPDGSLPLLTPMSEIAGRMAVLEGAKYLERPMLGRGILLSGVPGVEPAHVVILGGGIVGANAAKIAAGIGANVTILDVNLERLRYLDDVMPRNVTTLYSNRYTIREKLKQADLLIGAVLLRGARAPILVTRSMLKLMKPGAVIVDVAVDQGGCVETIRPTTHSNPTYVVDGIVHYGVANMPGAVAGTSTYALTNETLPYVVKLANLGYPWALMEDSALRAGLNIAFGKVVLKPIAEQYSLPYTPVEEVLGEIKSS